MNRLNDFKNLSTKKQGWQALLCLLVLSTYTTFSAADHRVDYSSKQLISVKLDVGEWPPYIVNNLSDEKITAPGVLQTIVNEVFNAAHVQVDTFFKPWVRVEYDVDLDHSISYGWIKNKKRQKKWLYSMPIITGESGFFYRKKEPFQWKHYADLKGFTIATARGYSYGTKFDETKPLLHIFENSEELNSLKMLIKGRVDLVVMDPIVARQLLHSHFTQAEKNTLAYDNTHPVKKYRLHLICAKTWSDCPKVIKIFNQGLMTLGRDYINEYMNTLKN